MKLIRKIIVVTIAFLLLFLATGIFIAEKYEKAIINYFIKDVNKFVKSEIRINKVDVTFLKKFPNISVWLKNTYIESPDKTYGDTLLFVKDIYLQFNAIKLIKKDYQIKSIDIQNGLCNLNISSKGEKNYIFWVKSEKKESQIDLKLNKIKLSNVSVTYNNQLKLFNSIVNIDNSILSGKIGQQNWAFDINQNVTVEKFKLKEVDFIESDKNIQTKLSLSQDSLDLKINEGHLKIGKTNFLINGPLGNIKNPDLNLTIKGNEINIGDAFDLIANINPMGKTKLKTTGNIDFNANITGKILHNQLPHISGNFDLENGNIYYKNEKINIDNIFLNGEFDNHNKKTLDYSTLTINNFQYSIENNTSKGKLLLENFHQPKVDLEITGNAPLILIEKVLFNHPDIKKAEGNILYDLNFNGEFNASKNLSKNNIKYINIKGTIQVDNCNLQLNKNIRSIDKINGIFEFGDKTTIKNLSFIVNKNDFILNGQITNLNDYLLKNEELDANIELFSNNIDITALINKSATNKKIPTNTAGDPLKLPDKLKLNGGFVIKNFALSDFSAKNCRGRMKYRNGILTLNSVFFESMEGNISGGGVLAQTTDYNFSIKAQSKLNNINITEMMKSFHNFGQTIINEKHISGNLAGNITLSTQLYNNFNINKNSILLNSYMEIENGRLANFTPLMGLSKFFKTSELADIHFSRFENSIAISDKTIYFTDMKINSSVTDLLGSGIHGFDNSYEYKVKVKLSELLSGKVDKPEITQTPFGEIEKEELKGTYLPIKISGTGDDYKVNPDFEETRKSIKTNIETEKQTLKSIFNEEFGKKKMDSTIKKDTSKKPAFKIEWDEEEGN